MTHDNRPQPPYSTPLLPMPEPDCWGPPTESQKERIKEIFSAGRSSEEFTVVIVHYNKPQETSELLRSIKDWKAQPLAVHVADNSAPHHDWGDWSEFPIPITIHAFTDNPGYGEAVNRIALLGHVTTDFFLILTHETVVGPDVTENLMNAMTSLPEVAVCAPALVYKSKPDRYFSLGGKLSHRGVAKHQGMGTRVSEKESVECLSDYVDWADGSCLLIRTDIFRILHGFDPRYFLYVEEIDFQFRARLTESRVALVSSTRVAQGPGDYPLFLKYRNHLWFTRKLSPSLKPWPVTHHLLRDLIRFLLRREKENPIKVGLEVFRLARLR